MSNKKISVHFDFEPELKEILDNRDKVKYPKQMDLIRDLLQKQGELQKQIDYGKAFREMQIQLKMLCELHKMNIREDAKKGRYYTEYPGGLPDIEKRFLEMEDQTRYELPDDFLDQFK